VAAEFSAIYRLNPVMMVLIEKFSQCGVQPSSNVLYQRDRDDQACPMVADCCETSHWWFALAFRAMWKAVSIRETAGRNRYHEKWEMKTQG
jgi:hypothetical protein